MRLERMTVCLEGRCSIQLSYRTILATAKLHRIFRITKRYSGINTHLRQKNIKKHRKITLSRMLNGLFTRFEDADFRFFINFA